MMDGAPIRTEIPRDVHFEDVEIGARYRTPARTISAGDIRAFCDLTGDHHPLHTDAAYARSQGFADILAHGLFCLSLMEGLKTASGLYEHTSVASLGWDAVKFLAPVVAGDTVHVEFAFAAKRPSAKGGRGVVTEEVQLIHRNGRVLVGARHAALVIMRLSAI
ncbi:MaoC/PaaZ C-terminal domain-containing protein [Xanthobacter sp. KR7-225]|uniref:MaoC family dehydratase n=1 Tax=Xanthobacter sp. KR7-225 TaxID=3156613 RepID=UPI0032B53C91